MNTAKKSYLNKIILTYASLIYCIILLLLSGAVIMIQLKNHNIFLEQECTIFHRRIKDYESVYADMFNVSNDIKKMNSIDQYALASERNYYERMADVQKEIRQYSQQYQRNGYGIAIHLLEDSKMITELATLDLHYHLPQIHLDPEKYNDLLTELIHENRKYLLLFTDEQIVYLTNKNYLNQDVIIVINCPISRLVTKETPSYDFHITIRDDNVKDLRTIQDNQFQPDTSGIYTDDQITQSRIDNKLCLQTRSHYYDIIYSSLSTTPIYSSLNSTFLYLVLILILVFVTVFQVIVKISKRIYRPINELISTVSEEEPFVNPDSASNEMDFLLGRVKNIQSQNQELLQVVDTHKQLVSQSVLVKLMSNAYHTSAIRPLMEDLDILWLDESCRLILFDTVFLDQDIRISTADIIDILKQYFLKGKTCLYTELAEHGICCVFPKNEFDPSVNLVSYAHEILVKIENELDYTLTAFIAPESQNLNTLSASYNIATFMREEYVRLPIKTVYTYQDYEHLFESSVGYPLSIERDLITAVCDNNWNTIEKIIDEIFEIYISKTFYEKNLREMNVISLINTINRSIQKASLNISDVLHDSQYLLLELKMAGSSQELCSKTKDIFRMIISHYDQNLSIQTKDLGQQLQQYISSNYTKDISLNDIADSFSLSPNYMSMLFKKTLNTTFKDYLAKYRCKKAAELLKEYPDMHVQDISAAVGIQNVNTFIRLFKKYYFTSPGKYKIESAK